MLYKVYEEMFAVYLNRLRKWYAESDSIEWQKRMCRICEEYEYKLKGMLDMMHQVDEITAQKRDAEEQRVGQEFSSLNLFGLRLGEDGSLYEYGGKDE